MTIEGHPPAGNRNPPAGLPVARAVVIFGLLGTLAAAAWIARAVVRNDRLDGRGGLSTLLRVDRDVPEGGRYPGDPYVGSRACAECHPGEYALFTGSGHARTFRPASTHPVTQRLAGAAIRDPEQPDVVWKFATEGQRFVIGREQAGKIERIVVDYALGSGHHATTYVTATDLDPLKILEHRLTFFTEEAVLKITPGQAARGRKPGTMPHGRELAGHDALKCFRCHVTQLSARGGREFEPATMIPAVTCERCHGPGRTHVEAARKRPVAGDLSMPLGLGEWTAPSLLEFCGQCHRHPSRVAPDRLNPDDPALVRFQPIGLTQSRCFQGSGGRLSCVSCHDPHARSSSSPADYERVCQSCHQPDREASDRAENPVPASVVAGRACPVSPTPQCLSCHMPKVDSGQHVAFTDHWIRVNRAARGRPAEEGGL
jgi:hypothetical protein